MAYQQITRFNQGRPITEDEMRVYAPSIFATEAHSSRSERFVPIPTIEMVRALNGEGWVPVMAGQTIARSSDKQNYTKHMVRFRRVDRELSTHGSVVELVLRNGNDGSSGYKLDAGVFRIACLNGLVAKSADYGTINVRHTGHARDKVIEGSYEVLQNAERVLAAPQDWSSIQLSRPEQLAFAGAAHLLRFERDEAGNAETNVKVEQLIQPRRYEDRLTDLWTTFNVVQENAVRGGLTAPSMNPTDSGYRRQVTTREVRGIDQNVKLNMALWALTEQMAQLKKAN
jgi:hypothetical protein